MLLHSLNQDVLPQEPSLFSVEEYESFYLVSIDLPSLPMEATEIVRNGKEISVQSFEKTIFHLKSQHPGARASYEDGSLWLMLPKNKKPGMDSPHPG